MRETASYNCGLATEGLLLVLNGQGYYQHDGPERLREATFFHIARNYFTGAIMLPGLLISRVSTACVLIHRI